MDDGAMRVLVAIDGSEPAGLAVDLVADVAWPAGTEIVVGGGGRNWSRPVRWTMAGTAMVQADRDRGGDPRARHTGP